MKEIIVKSQAEFDALPKSFDEYTRILIQSPRDMRLIVKVARGNSSVEAWENSSVEAWENSSVVAWGNSSVEAWGNSSVVARGNSSVVAWENSSVEAWGNSSVVARGNSSVEAWGNSSVVARGNSSVVARENSSVEAWENSSVVAWENSSVEAWENSSVVARENSSVEAWENSSVVARGNVAIHNFSINVSIELWAFAVVFLIQKARKLVKKSKTCTVITPKPSTGTKGWLETEGISPQNGKVILFKRVSKDFKTQENSPNETLWNIGSVMTHPAWSPKEQECNGGKFHACSRPYFCDQFRDLKGDRYIAIEVAVKDLYAWPNPQYPHKIAVRKCTVIYECNKFGKKI